MKRLLTIICLLAGLTAYAQMRTYSDNESKTFIVGLESYFFGESGTLDFSIDKASFKASLASGAVCKWHRLGIRGGRHCYRHS